jgi:uncharacterized membrane protein YbhN (UPF0104 family)
VSRPIRFLLLAFGLGMVALLVWRTGPALVLSMMARVRWAFLFVSAAYAIHIAVRAAALWRSVLSVPIRYRDVLRIRVSGEAVEMLTFTGPFLAEPAKGWLLKRQGLPAADAYAAVAAEYLIYTLVSSWLAALALTLLLANGALPPAIRPGVVGVLVVMVGFNLAFVFAAVAGVGVLAPLARASGAVIGRARAASVAQEVHRVESVLIAFLHAHPIRLAEVIGLEAAGHLLLVLEIWIVMSALGYSLSWRDPLLVEGGVKFISVAFSFIPGQVGASEGVYALLLRAIGLPAAAGLTLALVRRVRGLLVAAIGAVVISVVPER